MKHQILQMKEVYFYNMSRDGLSISSYIGSKKNCFLVRVFYIPNRIISAGMVLTSGDGKYVLESVRECYFGRKGWCDLEFYSRDFFSINSLNVKFRLEFPGGDAVVKKEEKYERFLDF